MTRVSISLDFDGADYEVSYRDDARSMTGADSNVARVLIDRAADAIKRAADIA